MEPFGQHSALKRASDTLSEHPEHIAAKLVHVPPPHVAVGVQEPDHPSFRHDRRRDVGTSPRLCDQRRMHSRIGLRVGDEEGASPTDHLRLENHVVEQLGLVAAHPQDLPRPLGVTLDIDSLRNPQGPVDPRDHGPVEADTACLFGNSVDQPRDRGDPMEPPEGVLHAREGRNALGEPGLAKPPLRFLELQEKVDRLGAAPRKGGVQPILPESLGDTLRRGGQGSLRGRKVDDGQDPRIAVWSTQVAHAVEHRQDITHGGAGNPRAMTEPRLLAIPGACGLRWRRGGFPDRVCLFGLPDARRRGVTSHPGAARPGHQLAAVVRGPGAGFCGGMRDHRGQPASGLHRPKLLFDIRAQDVLLDLAGSCHGQG